MVIYLIKTNDYFLNGTDDLHTQGSDVLGSSTEIKPKGLGIQKTIPVQRKSCAK
jgi:hypothetical protein